VSLWVVPVLACLISVDWPGCRPLQELAETPAALAQGELRRVAGSFPWQAKIFDEIASETGLGVGRSNEPAPANGWRRFLMSQRGAGAWPVGAK